MPQGAILSPLLFSIFISDIPNIPGVEFSAFADDLCVFLTADDYATAIRSMQVALDIFREWALKWKINVCSEKSCVQYFTRKKITYPPNLKYGDIPLKYEVNHKFLGVYFDSPSLTWKKHIEETVKNCNKRLDIMKASTATYWGADRKTLLIIYKSFIRSKIDYGSVAFGSACNTILNKLEVVQNTALRISVGALKSTPIVSLRCETQVCSIKDRIDFNVRKFFNKAHYLQPDNPVKNIISKKHIVATWNWNASTNKKPAILRAEAVRLRLSLPLIRNNENILLPSLPPWDRFVPKVSTHLIINAKNNLPENVIQAIFKITMSKRYPNFIQVYTDGSKSESANVTYVGAAFCIPEINISFGCRLQGLHSIAAAELYAIKKALEWISENMQPTKIVICTDSTAALLSLTAKKPEYLLIISSCLMLIKDLCSKGYTINFQWVPSHSGISGNEAADKGAKAASKLTNINNYLKPSLNDHNALLKKHFNIYLKDKWKDEGRERFLGKHKTEWEHWPWSENNNRKVEVAMARLRLGHSRLRAHLHRINMVDSPDCLHCMVPETIEHVLLQCHRHYSKRCILRQQLIRMGIINIDIITLLGGGNLDNRIKEKIANFLIKFLIHTGKINDI